MSCNGFSQRSVITLANSTGLDTNGHSSGAIAKVGTLAASGVNYFKLPCDRNVSKVDWVVSYNKAAAFSFYTAESNVTGCTLTLTDATGVDDGDTFVLNGLTFTAETTEEDAVASARKWYHPSQAVGAANLAVLLADKTYGVPGIGAITVTAPTTTDVLTIAGGLTPTYQFGQGASDANEIAFASTTLAGLIKDNKTTTVTDATATGNSTTAGTKFEQWTDGAPYVYLSVTNNAASDAMTYAVKAIRYWA